MQESKFGSRITSRLTRITISIFFQHFGLYQGLGFSPALDGLPSNKENSESEPNKEDGV